MPCGKLLVPVRSTQPANSMSACDSTISHNPALSPIPHFTALRISTRLGSSMYMGSYSSHSKMAILSDSSPLLWAICIYFVIVGAWTIYSVYLGPLASFPGPKLAAATRWYECYYDVILGGQYTFKIKELHRKYGMSDLSFSLRDM